MYLKSRGPGQCSTGVRGRKLASMTQKIPTAIIAVVSDALANRYTHAAIDQMMEAAGLELNPSPGGNKRLRRVDGSPTRTTPPLTRWELWARWLQNSWKRITTSGTNHFTPTKSASVKRSAITACRICKAATFSLSAQHQLAKHSKTSSAHATCLVCKTNSTAFTRTWRLTRHQR